MNCTALTKYLYTIIVLIFFYKSAQYLHGHSVDVSGFDIRNKNVQKNLEYKLSCYIGVE